MALAPSISTPTTNPSPTLHTVQALRGISALWVLLYHAQLTQGHTNSWYSSVVSLGYLGVDLFFVISGFIMAMNTANSPATAQSSVRFALLRLFRIYSGWWPVFGLCLLWLTWLSGWPTNKDLLSSFWLISLNIDTLLLPTTWTLTFELYFYALIALCLLLPLGSRSMALALFGTAVLALNIYWISQDRFSPELFEQSHWGMYLFFSPLCLEFLYGYFSFRWQRHLPAHLGWWLLACVLSGWAIASYALYFAHKPSGLSGFFHYPERAVLGGLFAACLLGFFLRATAYCPRRLSLWCGDISYMLYLLHLPAIWLVNSMLLHTSVMLRTLLVIVISLAAATLMHYGVERPIYSRVRRKLQTRKSAAH